MASPVLINLGCGNAWHPAWRNYDLAPSDPAISPIDLTQPLPLADGSVDAVYHAHVLEHLDPEDAQRLLRECLRVLKPQGVLRVVIPDLELHARNYLGALERNDPLEHEWAVIQLVDQMVRNQSEGRMGKFLRNRPWRGHDGIARWVSPEVGVLPPGPRPRAVWSRLRYRLAGLWLNQHERNILREARFRATGECHRWMYDRVALARLLQDTGYASSFAHEATTSAIESFASYALDTNPAGAIRHPDSLYLEARKE